MPAIVFNCPATGREIQSGIDSDAPWFKEMASQMVTLTCPDCGQPHSWRMRDGHLAIGLPGER